MEIVVGFHGALGVQQLATVPGEQVLMPMDHVQTIQSSSFKPGIRSKWRVLWVTNTRFSAIA
ncbi:MAG: hypothetical protein Q8Q84_12870, partial [Hydrogenophaga sp.]|nr:hypothetical protein [Hydrogenophaga sp.]